MISSSCSSWVKPVMAAALLISRANGLNTCLDPSSNMYTCVPGMTEITFFHSSTGCDGLVDGDMPDLQACFDTMGRSGLEDISITGNTELTSIPEDLFEGMGNLKNLRISTNEMLGSLPEGLFKDNAALIDLNLMRDGLTALPVAIFEGLSNVEELRLQYNSLTTVPAGVFAPLTSLEELYLHGDEMMNMQCLPASTADYIRLNTGATTERGTCGCTPEDAVSCPEGTTCSSGTEGYTCGDGQSPTPSVGSPLPVVSTSTVDEPTCSNGLPGYEAFSGENHVCCPVGCNGCGGSNCSKIGKEAGLTRADCCTGGVLSNQVYCSASGAAPCIIT
ncbi:unnamed protein product [Pylaiella littoralis]